MKPNEKRIQQLNASPDPCPKPSAMALEAPPPPTEGGMLIYRELTSGEIFAVSGGPQIINDGLLPPPPFVAGPIGPTE